MVSCRGRYLDCDAGYGIRQRSRRLLVRSFTRHDDNAACDALSAPAIPLPRWTTHLTLRRER